jgi:transcriptional regulator with XRE-family HTH domain
MTEPFTNLIHASLKEFGRLLREICEVAGFTQAKLARESEAELERLMECGDIKPDDYVGSMRQPAISRVMLGSQEPTYYQVYIWLKVLRVHFESEHFAEICREEGTPLPTFPSTLEAELWRLSTRQPPDELHEVCERNKDVILIQIISDEVGP